MPSAWRPLERVRSSRLAKSEVDASLGDSHSYVIIDHPVQQQTFHRARPVQWEVHGFLTLKASPTHSNGLCAKCSVLNRALILSIVWAPRASSSACSAMAVAVPFEELAVVLERGRNDMFIIATRNGHKLYDDISCFARNQQKRDKWIAVFKQMEVPIFDLS